MVEGGAERQKRVEEDIARLKTSLEREKREPSSKRRSPPIPQEVVDRDIAALRERLMRARARSQTGHSPPHDTPTGRKPHVPAEPPAGKPVIEAKGGSGDVLKKPGVVPGSVKGGPPPSSLPKLTKEEIAELGVAELVRIGYTPEEARGATGAKPLHPVPVMNEEPWKEDVIKKMKEESEADDAAREAAKAEVAAKAQQRRESRKAKLRTVVEQAREIAYMPFEPTVEGARAAGKALDRTTNNLGKRAKVAWRRGIRPAAQKLAGKVDRGVTKAVGPTGTQSVSGDKSPDAAPATMAGVIPSASGTRSLIRPKDANDAVNEIIRRRGSGGDDAGDGVERTLVARGGTTQSTAPTGRMTQPDGESEQVTEDNMQASREASHREVAAQYGSNPDLRDFLQKITAIHGSGVKLDHLEPEPPQLGDKGYPGGRHARVEAVERDERLGAAIEAVKDKNPWKQEAREQLRESIARKKQRVRNAIIPKRIRDDNDNGRFLGSRPEGISAKVRGTLDDLKKLRQRKKGVDGKAATDIEAAPSPMRDAEPAVPQQPAEERPRQPEVTERPPEEIVSDIERVERVADDVAQDVRRSKENVVPQAAAESIRPKKGFLRRALSGEWGRQRETSDYEAALKGDFGFMYEWSGKDDAKRIWAANNAISNQIGLTARRMSDSSIGRQTLLHLAQENLEGLLARSDGKNIEWKPTGEEESAPVFLV